jgi:diguanylate cyclase (GGDEF)-like protein
MAPINVSRFLDRWLTPRDIDEIEPTASLVDPLTRLPTRAAVVRELRNCLTKSHHRHPVALAIVDFSNVRGLVENGESVDPGLLVRLAKLLTTHVPDHVVGHLRDREFAIILCDTPITEVEHIADEIINSVRSDASLETERRYIATIVGIGYSSRGDCRASQLMSLADIALHYALATGRGCHVIVDRVPSARAS